MYRSLKKSNVTVIELDQLENKLRLFSIRCTNSLDDPAFDLVSRIEDF